MNDKATIFTDEVLPGLMCISSSYHNRCLNQYFLRGENLAVLVDTGAFDTPSRVIGPCLRQAGVSPELVRLVIITHADADHFGGNGLTRHLFPLCLIAAHKEDAPWIESPRKALSERYGEFSAYGMPLESIRADQLLRAMGDAIPVDLLLQGGEAIRLARSQIWQVLHTPGHSPGHLALWNEAWKVAIVGDAVLGEGVPSLENGLALAPTYRYTAAYLETIERLEALDAEWLLTSHFPVMRGSQVGDFLRLSREWVQRTEQTILCVLQEAADSLDLAEIIVRAKPLLGQWLNPDKTGLEYPILGGLEYLEQRTLVYREQKDGRIVWHV